VTGKLLAGEENTFNPAREVHMFHSRSRMRRSIYYLMGRAKKVFAPFNDKYAGSSRLPGTFLWFVSFMQKK